MNSGLPKVIFLAEGEGEDEGDKPSEIKAEGEGEAEGDKPSEIKAKAEIAYLTIGFDFAFGFRRFTWPKAEVF